MAHGTIPMKKLTTKKSFRKEGHAWSAKKLIVPAAIVAALTMIGYIFAAAL